MYVYAHILSTFTAILVSSKHVRSTRYISKYLANMSEPCVKETAKFPGRSVRFAKRRHIPYIYIHIYIYTYVNLHVHVCVDAKHFIIWLLHVETFMYACLSLSICCYRYSVHVSTSLMSSPILVCVYIYIYICICVCVIAVIPCVHIFYICACHRPNHLYPLYPHHTYSYACSRTCNHKSCLLLPLFPSIPVEARTIHMHMHVHAHANTNDAGPCLAACHSRGCEASHLRRTS